MRNGAGWLEGLTINSTEPQPSNEVMRDGRIVLGFDSLNAGERLTFWTQYQVNPTTVAHRDPWRIVTRASSSTTALGSLEPFDLIMLVTGS